MKFRPVVRLGIFVVFATAFCEAQNSKTDAAVLAILTKSYVTVDGEDWLTRRTGTESYHVVQLHKPQIKLQEVPLTKADRLNGISWKGSAEIQCDAYRELDIARGAAPKSAESLPWQRWQDVTQPFAGFPLYCENGDWKVANFEIFNSSYVRTTKPLREEITDFQAQPVSVQGTAATFPTPLDPAHSRPRPQVVKQQKTRPAIFTENKFGTSNIGPTAVDARWSNYGAYLQRLIDTVQVQWENILISGKIYPPAGSTVTVTFVLDSEGKIARLVNVENKSSEQAAHACASAITDRAPYGPWTDNMIAMLGKQQEITFTFYYR